MRAGSVRRPRTLRYPLYSMNKRAGFQWGVWGDGKEVEGEVGMSLVIFWFLWVVGS